MYRHSSMMFGTLHYIHEDILLAHMFVLLSVSLILPGMVLLVLLLLLPQEQFLVMLCQQMLSIQVCIQIMHRIILIEYEVLFIHVVIQPPRGFVLSPVQIIIGGMVVAV